MSDALRCSWCGRAATGMRVVVPPRYGTTKGGHRILVRLERKVPCCDDCDARLEAQPPKATRRSPRNAGQLDMGMSE